MDWVGLTPAAAEPEAKPAPSSKQAEAPSPSLPRPVDPPEQRLPQYLAPLCDGLAAYFEEHGPNLDELYR